MIYLVRHGAAESRKAWDDDDSLRPLTKKGRRQAAGLAGVLRSVDGAPVARVLSSPSLRCVQTVEPLAVAYGLDVETAPELLEGTPATAAVEIVRRQARAPTSTVLCTHGDIVPGILDGLRKRGLRLLDPHRWAKGSTWAIDGDGDRFDAARYLAPPDH